jgi:tRNA threonylcarbamoyladenosine biosynthesis protein TsaE
LQFIERVRRAAQLESGVARLSNIPAGVLEIISRSAEQTERLGTWLGQLLAAGDVVCLAGGLGAGKTTFAVGIGRGWGSASRLTSPTYTLVHIHRRATDRQVLYHVDAYRLETPTALESVGFAEIFEGSGPVIIEWPERLKEVLPEAYLWVELWPDDDEDAARRLMVFSCRGEPCEHYELLLAKFRQMAAGV